MPNPLELLEAKYGTAKKKVDIDPLISLEQKYNISPIPTAEDPLEALEKKYAVRPTFAERLRPITERITPALTKIAKWTGLAPLLPVTHPRVAKLFKEPAELLGARYIKIEEAPGRAILKRLGFKEARSFIEKMPKIPDTIGGIPSFLAVPQLFPKPTNPVLKKYMPKAYQQLSNFEREYQRQLGGFILDYMTSPTVWALWSIPIAFRIGGFKLQQRLTLNKQTLLRDIMDESAKRMIPFVRNKYPSMSVTQAKVVSEEYLARFFSQELGKIGGLRKVNYLKMLRFAKKLSKAPYPFVKDWKPPKPHYEFIKGHITGKAPSPQEARYATELKRIAITSTRAPGRMKPPIAPTEEVEVTGIAPEVGVISATEGLEVTKISPNKFLALKPIDMDDLYADYQEGLDKRLAPLNQKVEALGKEFQEAPQRSPERKRIKQELEKVKEEMATIDNESTSRFYETQERLRGEIEKRISQRYKLAEDTEMWEILDEFFIRTSEPGYREVYWQTPQGEILQEVLRDYVKEGKIIPKAEVKPTKRVKPPTKFETVTYQGEEWNVVDRTERANLPPILSLSKGTEWHPGEPVITPDELEAPPIAPPKEPLAKVVGLEELKNRIRRETGQPLTDAESETLDTLPQGESAFIKDLVVTRTPDTLADFEIMDKEDYHVMLNGFMEKESKQALRGEITLYQAVKKLGGIKSYKKGTPGALVEEYNTTVAVFLRNKEGRTLDEMASALAEQYPQFGIETESELLEALKKEKMARINGVREEQGKYIADKADKLIFGKKPSEIIQKSLFGPEEKVPLKPKVAKPVPKQPELPFGARPKFEMPIAKEPWQMTLSDFIDSRQEGPFRLDIFEAKNIHKEDVQQALSQGKPVPPEVLKDYPKLKAKIAEPTVVLRPPTKAEKLKSKVELIIKKKGIMYARDMKIETHKDVADIFYELKNTDREKAFVLNLDENNRIINVENTAIGTLMGAEISARETFKNALLSRAKKVWFIHNHPSGNVEPSGPDLRMNDDLNAYAKSIGLEFEGFVIMNRTEFGYISPLKYIGAIEVKHIPKRGLKEIPLVEIEAYYNPEIEEARIVKSAGDVSLIAKSTLNWETPTIISFNLSGQNEILSTTIVGHSLKDIDKSVGLIRKNAILSNSSAIVIATNFDLRKPENRLSFMDLVDRLQRSKEIKILDVVEPDFEHPTNYFSFADKGLISVAEPTPIYELTPEQRTMIADEKEDYEAGGQQFPPTEEIVRRQAYERHIMRCLKSLAEMAPKDMVTNKQKALAHILAQKKKLTTRQLHRLEKIISGLTTMGPLTPTGRIKKTYMTKQQAGELIKALHKFFVPAYKKPSIPRGKLTAKDLQVIKTDLMRKPMRRVDVARLIRNARKVIRDPQFRPHFVNAYWEWVSSLKETAIGPKVLSMDVWSPRIEKKTGLPIYSGIYLPFEDAARGLKVATMKFWKEVKDIWGTHLKSPEPEDGDLALRVHHALIGDDEYFVDAPLTNEELKIVEKCREFYDKYFAEFDIGNYREYYSPRIRESGGVKVAYAGRIPKELRFFAELERVGLLSPLIEDERILMRIYFYAGARKKHYGPVLKQANEIKRFLPPNTLDAVDAYVGQKLGYGTKGERLLEKVVDNVMNKTLQLNIPPQLVTSLYFTSVYGGALGFRLKPIVRNAFQTFLMGYPEYGKWLAPGLRRTFKPSGVSKWRDKGFLVNWGVPEGQEIDRAIEGVGSSAERAINLYRKYVKVGLIPYGKWIDTINRCNMANACESRFNHWLKKYKDGKISLKKFAKKINLKGEDIFVQKEVINHIQNKNYEKALDRLLMVGIDNTQWPYRKGTAPQWGYGLGKFASTFWIWPHRYAETLVGKWLLRKQWGKIWRWVVVSYAINELGKKVKTSVLKWAYLGPLAISLTPMLNTFYHMAGIFKGASWNNKREMDEHWQDLKRSAPVFIGYGIFARNVYEFLKAAENNFVYYDKRGRYKFKLTPTEALLRAGGFMPMGLQERRKITSKFYNEEYSLKKAKRDIKDMYLTGKHKEARKNYRKFIRRYKEVYVPLYKVYVRRYGRDYMKRTGKEVPMINPFIMTELEGIREQK